MPINSWGMLLTRRMERAGLKPIGFVATDYALAIWSLKPVEDPVTLLSADMLGDDLEEWMQESTMMKRSHSEQCNNSRTFGKASSRCRKNRPSNDCEFGSYL